MKAQSSRCETCKFWDELKKQLQVSEGRAGYCRFHAPGRSTLYTGLSRAFWPTTFDHEWCGQWNEKDKKDNESP